MITDTAGAPGDDDLVGLVGLTPEPAADANAGERFYVMSLQWSHGREIITWWAPKRSGYTAFLDGAGVYTRAEVQATRLSDGESTLAIPVSVAREVAHLVVHERDTHLLLAAGERTWSLKVRHPRERMLIEALSEVQQSITRALTEDDDEDRAILLAGIASTAEHALRESAERAP